MAHVPSSGIEDLYRSVIQDVVEQSKEAFLDENIDIDVLFQIQKSWEDKINASGAADLDSKFHTGLTSLLPYTIKQQPQQVNPETQLLYSNFQPWPIEQQLEWASEDQPDLSSEPLNIKQEPETASKVECIPVAPQPSKSKQSHKSNSQPRVASTSRLPYHMSDSDESDVDDDELMDELIGMDDKNIINENTIDETPLNSGDDQSEDEDLDTLFESNNIMVCQFEKVNRARNKWKFTLRDGIMHLEGKDFCFQKCIGEAEW